MVKSFDNGDNVYSINTAGSAIGENGDENMFFQGEGARIQREGAVCEGNGDCVFRESCSHQPSKRKRNNLS